MIVDHVLFQGKSVQTRMDVHELFGPEFEGVSPDMPMHLARTHSKVSNVPACVQDSYVPVQLYIVTADLCMVAKLFGIWPSYSRLLLSARGT